MKKDLFINILLLGFGSIGQALSHSLRNYFKSTPIHTVDMIMNEAQLEIASKFKITTQKLHIKSIDDLKYLKEFIHEKSLILNFATSISSCDLIKYTQNAGAFYLDSCIDPWHYKHGIFHTSENTNYQMREEALKIRTSNILIKKLNPFKKFPTAIFAHGANPGFVSVLVKQALIEMSKEFLKNHPNPIHREQWTALAKELGVRVIQISEKDSQKSNIKIPSHEFANTWSVNAFIAEALQPAELGWGSHEEKGQHASIVQRHNTGCKAAVYYPLPGKECEVKTWTPSFGTLTGHLISHNEAISLADYFTEISNESLIYRPTVYYAYHPCAEAQKILKFIDRKNHYEFINSRILKSEINKGIDELGILLLSDKFPSTWLGSQLSIERARSIAPYNNATSLQVVGSVMAALKWIEKNPDKGLIESEDLDHQFIFDHAREYWEPIKLEFKQWHPSGNFKKNRWTIDQFLNFKNQNSNQIDL